MKYNADERRGGGGEGGGVRGQRQERGWAKERRGSLKSVVCIVCGGEFLKQF